MAFLMIDFVQVVSFNRGEHMFFFLMWTLQVAIQRLRERLSHALGQQAAAPAAPTHVRRAYPQQPATAQPLPQHSFTPIQPAMVPRPAAAAPVPVPTPAASAPAQPQYYQPVCILNKFLLLWFSSDLCETCITEFLSGGIRVHTVLFLRVYGTDL